MKPVVFVTTNANQLAGAKVARWLFQSRAARPEAFEVRLLRLRDAPQLTRREGQRYRRKGRAATWRNDDLQSFSPLRFLPPQLLAYRGRALVVDPDVFALADPGELLRSDMGGRSILCRRVERPGKPAYWNTSVMLLDCARLRHWDWDAAIGELFAQAWDYGDWIRLGFEAEDAIGPLEARWNDFDRLGPTTALLHTTERSTQPWKTGLPVDYDTTWRLPPRQEGRRARLRRVLGMLRRPRALVRRLRERPPPRERYRAHPDPYVEPFFFAALAGCLDAGAIGEDELRGFIAARHVRADAFQLVRRYRGWRPPWSAGVVPAAADGPEQDAPGLGGAAPVVAEELADRGDLL